MTLSQSKGAKNNTLYRQLKFDLAEAGCFEPTRRQHFFEAMMVIALYAAGYTILLQDPHIALRMLALAIVAFACVRSGIIAHEVGHGSLTQNKKRRILYGHFFMTFLTAVGFGHWQDIHNRHHPHTNSSIKDPDIESCIFSLHAQSASEKSQFGKLVTKYQAYLLWPLVSLQGFTLKIDSFRFMFRTSKPVHADWAAMACHAVLWFGIPIMVLGVGHALTNYAIMTWFLGPYLGTIFLFNHIGTKVVEPDDDISFLHRQILTTRNLGSSRLSDFIFGGMNNHIEHHLFPRIPKARLRQARPIVKDFCKQENIPYREVGWWSACVELFRYLQGISAAAVTPPDPERDEMTPTPTMGAAKAV